MSTLCPVVLEITFWRPELVAQDQERLNVLLSRLIDDPEILRATVYGVAIRGLQQILDLLDDAEVSVGPLR